VLGWRRIQLPIVEATVTMRLFGLFLAFHVYGVVGLRRREDGRSDEQEPLRVTNQFIVEVASVSLL
jgi:uncharacterized membrane protein